MISSDGEFLTGGHFESVLWAALGAQSRVQLGTLKMSKLIRRL